MKSGNTVDFSLFLTSETLDGLTILLRKNGSVVAMAQIYSDTRHRGLVWRERVAFNSTFEVALKRSVAGMTTIA